MRLSKPVLSHGLEPNTSIYCPRCRKAMYVTGGGAFVVCCMICGARMSITRVVTASAVDTDCYRLEWLRHGQNQ
jgi:hypothetical protein